MPWIDDLTGGDVNKARAAWAGRHIVAHLQQLGWIIQQKKCIGVGEPLTCIPSLGLEIDFFKQQYRATERRLQQIEAMATGLLRRKRVAARSISQIAGTIISQFAALGSASRIRTRSLQACVETRPKPDNDPTGRKSWDATIVISPEARAELQWWLKNARSVNGQSIAHLHPSLHFRGELWGDASATGWGGYVKILDPTHQTKAIHLFTDVAKKSPLRITAKKVSSRLRKGIEVMGGYGRLYRAY
jgi:hypothetical protein